MKYNCIFTTITAMLLAFAGHAQVGFSGMTKPVFEETPAKSTGLDKIYVLHNTAGVSMNYTASTGQTVTWYTYGEQGGGHAEELNGIVRNGNVSTLSQVIANKGYVIEEGTKRTYVWVVNYADYYLALNSLMAESDGDCGSATINVNGNGPDMVYYAINGVRHLLDRQMKLQYYTLVWNNESKQYTQESVSDNQETFKPTIVIQAPLCNTSFKLSGDRFLDFWGEGVSVESDTYATAAVEVQTTAVQERRENNNEKGTGDGSTLGGSAPVNITFTAHCSDAVVHKEWQMATDAEFKNIQLRLNQEVVEQSFTEAGTFYWRFIGSNATGTCEAYGETYTVNIGESELVCPNIFSPGSTQGVNDVWKVSYKSIIEFRCWIFNSWGVQICELTDPSQGWDGTYKGKLVAPGVYYYVIQAKGADGKKYKLDGDINILRYKKNKYGTSSGSEAGE